MSPLHFCLLLLSLSISLPSSSAAPSSSSPYLSAATLFPNYQKMLNSFKIFIYTLPNKTAFTFKSPTEALFASLLLNSSFTTQDPEEAHLFFIPLPFSSLSMRSKERAVAELRASFPYWNRTLGADHFFVSCAGLGHFGHRNIVELKKNSILVSCFPTPPAGNFIPHKDVALPPLANVHAPHALGNSFKSGNPTYLGYVRHGWVKDVEMVKDFSIDGEILIESEPSDQLTYEERLAGSKFCLFEYGVGDTSMIGEAMSFGCVPVLMTDRPIQDMPFMEVLTWQKMAVFVGTRGGVQEVKRELRKISGEDSTRYEEMKGLCLSGSEHFEWKEKPQPHDAFHMVMYQLWIKRHTIRYVQREWV